jgi:hypothetical protein
MQKSKTYWVVKNVLRKVKGLKSGSGLEEYDSPQTKEQKQFVLT